METRLRPEKILIVDDEISNTLLLRKLLTRTGYHHIHSTEDPREILALYVEIQPDLILMDLIMPVMDGFQLMTLLRQMIAPGNFMPILVLTADITQATRERALEHGATDFLTKPFDTTEITLRINNLLQTRRLYVQLEQQRQSLEQQVFERTHEVEEARSQLLTRLALAAEYRDDVTGRHTQRVGRMAAILGSAIGLPEREVLMLRQAAPLHDVGKIGISDAILLKPGKLTPAEFEVMKTHTTIGARILKDDNVPLLHLAEIIALTHHERWDGTGYPQGLSGETIPLVGRIVAVADAYDALTHARPYKQAWSVQTTVAEIQRQTGHQFDPAVVRAFLKLVQADRLREPESLRDDEATSEVWSDTSSPTPSAQPLHQPQLLDQLTPRELEVIRLIAQGQTNRDISQVLFISVATVKFHVEHILGKLGVADRTHAAVRAFELGLLQSEIHDDHQG